MEIQLPSSNATSRNFVFPSAYGGAVQSNEPPQIHVLLGELRRAVGSIAAKKQAGGPMFPVRGAKELNQKLADALNSLNMVAPVVDQVITLVDAQNIPKNENKSGNPVFRTLAHVKSTVRLIAPDTSFIDCVGSGHGGDVDDKSGGKASTYAWKDAIFKGLSIPHEDMVDTDDDSSLGDGEPGAVRGAGRKAAAKGGGKAVEGTREGAAGPDGGSQGEVGASSTQPGRVVGSGNDGNAVESDSTASSELGAVLKRIKGVDSLVSLELIREEIKSGELKLHGADKLKATQAWVARKEQLK